MGPREAAIALMARLERLEEPLLAWGVSDFGVSDEDLRSLVREVIAETGADAGLDEVIDYADEAGFIFIDDLQERTRSRAAETIRLLSRLRQLVHGDGSPPHWSTRPTLVRDFRFERRPRRYPRRDVPPREVVQRTRRALTPVGVAALEAMLKDPSGNDLPLSGFQSRSVSAVLDSIVAPESRAVMISAGTGAGKTKAFYLPVMAHLSGLVSAQRWTKVLAVYPRIELLKDQLTEAFRQARLLDDSLQGRGRRKIVLAAYYGDVPYSARSKLRDSWRRTAGGRICPFLKCPRCASDLSMPDRRKGHLECVKATCDFETGPDEILLDRRSMAESPPDVVFATGEMINRSLAHLSHGRIVGVGAQRVPQVVLLDEVHTYEGTSGAQTALMLRRWARRVGASNTTYVGLSATLRDPRRFLSQVTGVSESKVTSVSVEDSELESQSAEYLLALRNDAAAGAAVLSTTIQTCMLLARCLDHPNHRSSGQVFGTKIFAFTDNLDVVNRLYSNLCDAEGRFIWGKPIPNQESLAILRHPAADPKELDVRHLAGQSWELPVRLGNDLTPGDHLHIGRTHSKDGGVDPAARVITATASLEVGFDDPDVGAVIQHGAPRDVAQFLQRKGRAGRSTQMRPWTVVVLSEYGRDRASYQAWDLLFSPDLPPKHLPVQNRYLLRMHAASGLIDWLAQELAGKLHGSADLWRLLAGPAGRDDWYDKNREAQQRIANLLASLMDDPGVHQEFAAYLVDALRTDEATVDEILWHPPRAILLTAVPMLHRRLVTDWAGESHGNAENPLPEHVAANLFSALELPEVQVYAEQEKGTFPLEETMAFDRALREFCPGNVSRRAATSKQRASHWVAVPDLDTADVQRIEVAEAYPETTLLGEVVVPCSPNICSGPDACDGAPHRMDLLRPRVVRVVLAPGRLSPSSRSFPIWGNELRPRGEGSPVGLPGTPALAPLNLIFHLQTQRSWLETTRYVIGSDGSALVSGEERRYRTRLVRGSESVVLGVRTEVDACEVHLELPDGWESAESMPDAIRRGLRAAWLRYRFETNLDVLANRFKARWLHDAAVAAIALEVEVGGHDSVDQAVGAMEHELEQRMLAALDVLFERTDETEIAGSRKRIRDGLAELLSDPEVLGIVRETLGLLWAPLGAEVAAWTRARLRTTMGVAIHRAAQEVCLDHDPEVLLLDAGSGEESQAVWLTEAIPGGAGFLEALQRRVSDDPRAFIRSIRSALEPADGGETDENLRVAVGMLCTDETVAAAAAAFRLAVGPEEKHGALVDLIAALESRGVAATHTTVAALVSRILRPGTHRRSDELIQQLLDGRDKLEARLGIEVDSRIWAFIASEDETYEALGSGTGRAARLDAVESVLWRRGWESEADALSTWNPYEEHLPSMPALLRWRLQQAESPIVASGRDSLQAALLRLEECGEVVVETEANDPAALAELVSLIMAETVDVEVFRSRPRLADVRRGQGRIRATVELPEVV